MSVGESIAVEQALHPLEAAINTAVNSPVKMLAFLAIAEQVDRSLTAGEIKNRLNEAQGPTAGWEWEAAEGLKRYCRHGLVPAGLVTETITATSRGQIPSFRVTQRGIEWGVPLFGALLDLELRTEFSSQRTFGVYNSIPPWAKQREHSSLVRMQVLEHVYNAKDTRINLTRLCSYIPRHKTIVNNAIAGLVEVGLLHVLKKSNPSDRQIKLVRADEEWVARGKRTMRAEVAAVYDTTKILYRAGVRELDGASLLDAVERQCRITDRKALWRTVSNTPPRCLRFIDEDRFGSNKGRDAPRTRIEITREAESVVEELVRNLNALRESSLYRQIATKQAEHFLSEKGRSAVSYLMGKAQLNSKPSKRPKSEALQKMAHLASLVAGWISLRQQFSYRSDWHKRAACTDSVPELFFAPTGEVLTDDQAEAARSICNACEVSLQCLKWAVDKPERFGMWGGKTEQERKELSPGTLALLDLLQ